MSDNQKAVSQSRAGALLAIGLTAGLAAALISIASGPASAADAGSCDPARPHAAGDFSQTIDSREYTLHVPPSYNGSKAVPLVLNLHGLGSTAASQASYSDLGAKADQEGFIVVMPQGLSTALLADTHWNVVMFDEPEPDDVGFIADLLDALEAQLCVDAARIFAAGMSNGAQMSSRIGCSLSHRIAAIAPVSGVYYPPLAIEIPEPAGCPTTQPVPVIAFHGTEDPVISFDGGPAAGGVFMVTLRDIDDEVMPDWAATNGCAGTPTSEQVTENVHLIRYQGCDVGATVELYVITGGVHVWPGAVDLPDPDVNDEISANDLIWDFFQAHPLVPPVGGIAELPDVAGAGLEAEASSGPGASVVAGILAAGAAGFLALGSAAWYARRGAGRRG